MEFPMETKLTSYQTLGVQNSLLLLRNLLLYTINMINRINVFVWKLSDENFYYIK